MQKDDLILISVEDHIIEPPDLFAGRLPAKYAADAPRLMHRDDGTDAAAGGHDVSVQSRSQRIIRSEDKLEAYHSRARAALAQAR